MSYLKRRAVLAKHRAVLLAKANVVSVGIGYKRVNGAKTGSLAIVCGVTKKLPLDKLAKGDVVPAEIEGVITDVVETGVIKALKARTDRWRPAPGGVSVGHEWVTAGTLCCWVKKGGLWYMLSNNHVLADSNNGGIGSAIFQPGKYDGGSMIDRIATLSEFVKINWVGGEFECPIGKAAAGLGNVAATLLRSKTRLAPYSTLQVENLVDAALGKPVDDAWVEDDIYEIGRPVGINLDPHLGLAVQKSGRTTGVTQGVIEQIDVATQVQYGDGKVALFIDQLLITPGGFSAPGDSGSDVLDMQRQHVGLLFAGSDEATVANRIGHVWNLLDLDTVQA